MRSQILSILLVVGFGLFGQNELELQAITIPNLPGLQSFAHADYQGNWILIGGRKDGLHLRQPHSSFDNAGHNNEILVVDIQNQNFKRLSLQNLSPDLYDQLRSTNMEFYQEDSLLYLIGGYGISSSVSDHITHPYLTVVNLNKLIGLNNNDPAPAAAFTQVNHQDFAVTGGQLKKIDSTFYLVGGHRFDGRYNPHNGPSFVQNYTNAVRRFSLNWSNGNPQINWKNPIVDPQLLHRRDFNVLAQIDQQGFYNLIAYSGVFQVGVDLPYLSAVIIDSNGANELSGFSQYYNHYHCANVALYNAQKNEMHSLFFGGMAQYFDQNGTLTQDNNVPFVNTIARVSRDSNGLYQEFKLTSSMPALLGAGSEFFINPNLSEYAPGIIDFNALAGDTVLLGHIMGGIESSASNIFFSNTGNESEASAKMFAVYLIKSQIKLGLLNEASSQQISWQVAPNPSQNRFKIWYQQMAGNGIYELKILTEQGQLLKAQNWQAPSDKGNYYHEVQLERVVAGAYFLELWYQGQRISTQRLILR